MYLFILGSLFLFCIIEILINNKELKMVLVLFSSIIYFILIGFNDWSLDLEIYRYRFLYEIPFSKTEVIYNFFIKLLKNMNADFRILQIIYSSFIVILFAKFIYKNSKFPQVIYLNYFLIPFYPNMVQLRQFLGIALFLYSLNYYKNLKLFLMLGFFSVISHNSMIVLYLGLIMLRIFKIQKKNLVKLYIFMSIFLFFFSRNLIVPFIELINPKYLKYIENYNTFLGTIYLYLPYFIINNLIIFLDKKQTNDFESKEVLINMLIVSNFMIFPMFFIRDFIRFVQNIYIFVLIYATNYVFTGKKKERIILLIIMLLLTYGIFYWEFLALNRGEYFKVIKKTFESNSILN